MKSINLLLIALIALASCRTVHKTQSEDLKKSFTSEVVNRDSVNSIKVDGLFVRKLNADVVTREVSEYDTAGRITRKTKETIDHSKAIDSGAVGITNHSEIKEGNAKVKSEAVVTKLKTVDRKVSPWKIAGGLLLFTAVCLFVGLIIKHRKNILPI